jgi:DNA-binding transcriptional regulator YiaG
MTSTASFLSVGEILKQDSLGRVRTPLGKRQEILAAFDGSGMSAARFAAMVGINFSTFCSWVQERNQKQGKDSVLTGAAAQAAGAMDRGGDRLRG